MPDHKCFTWPDNETEVAFCGGCPECECHRVILCNVRDWNYGYCNVHHTRWLIGNILSSWEDETEAIWLANAERLLDYREVEPWFPFGSDDVGPPPRFADKLPFEDELPEGAR